MKYLTSLLSSGFGAFSVRGVLVVHRCKIDQPAVEALLAKALEDASIPPRTVVLVEPHQFDAEGVLYGARTLRWPRLGLTVVRVSAAPRGWVQTVIDQLARIAR